MSSKNSAKSLVGSRASKSDEFYTLLSDIEKEMQFYLPQFKDKIIYCNCDDPKTSNFWKYFYQNFENFGLKKLISTYYKPKGYSFKSEYDGKEIVRTRFVGDGDFRSRECVETLKECDIVITNPPFSLFKEFIPLMYEYGKKFIVLGNQNSITYKTVFPFIKNNQLWYGKTIHKGGVEFQVPSTYPLFGTLYRFDKDGQRYIWVKGVRWFTNLDYEGRYSNFNFTQSYSPQKYQKYDFYDAINVNKSCEIPYDYMGAMGVPISFFDKYDPNLFEILDANDYRISDKVKIKPHGLIKDSEASVGGKLIYCRLLIRRRS